MIGLLTLRTCVSNNSSNEKKKVDFVDMLKFLAREQSNVDKIESLKRKARDVHSSLKRVQLARAAIEAEQYVAKAPIANRGNNLVGIFDRGEVRGVLDCLVNELEQKFEIETVVT